jgi:hypothetical protein
MAHASFTDLFDDPEMIKVPPHSHQLPTMRARYLAERLKRRHIDLVLTDWADA